MNDLFVGGKSTPNHPLFGASDVVENRTKVSNFIDARRIRARIRQRRPRSNSNGKIVLQNDRNAQQHLGVDASAFEDVVDVGSLAIKFPREPAHRAFLPPEFRLDQFADMYHAVTQKKARTNSLSTSEVLDDPCNRMSGNARAETARASTLVPHYNRKCPIF